jgi:hypothetical protein
MDGQRFIAAVIATAFACVLVLPISSGAELIGADFAGVWDEQLIDEDRDGSYEELRIVASVSVFEAGSYGVYGMINGGIVHGSSGLVSLPSGKGEIAVPFSGADIITMRPGGHFDVFLQLYSSDPGSPVRTLTFATVSAYDPLEFERGSDYPWTSATVEGDMVIIKNPRVEIALNATRPLLSYSYPGHDETGATLEVVRLVAYDDIDGDGVFGPGDDVKYSSELGSEVDWRMEMDLRSGYRIDLHGDAPLRMVGSPEVTAWASVTITFDSSSIQPPGNSQKFDISIELLQMLDADGLAVIQELRDGSGERVFRYDESGIPANPEKRISLSDSEGIVSAIYSWNDAVLIGAVAADTPAMAGSAYRIAGSRAEVIFSYTLLNDTLFVYHDPTVGMDPDFLPSVAQRDDFMSNRPLGMAIGIVVGLAVVLGAVAAVRFRRG